MLNDLTKPIWKENNELSEMKIHWSLHGWNNVKTFTFCTDGMCNTFRVFVAESPTFTTLLCDQNEASCRISRKLAIQCFDDRKEQTNRA
ncbi:hypothetical protein KIN20_020424 [Parelaphostrongylus tenuis]|uniref:Uncharacterized protein n=1 Tax=Parelaphostrongylus tenuis TaxID=148309 RepID=A0AAD5QTQ5_PARTN|nr:hypothetical protein KIN20_020424 [Parelaphostrongylus tenuis]